MQRLLMFLLLCGVLSGLAMGQLVHVEHVEHTDHREHAPACEQVHKTGTVSSNDCSDAHGSTCHQHVCQHSVPPAVNMTPLAFIPASCLIGSVPAAPVPAIEEPVDEPPTPPLI